ncbi:MAG: hypothetical protein KDI19_09880 [Pseudomonadales bacterium]|nr:hypothetical protein [Pseudomonadales bacterium]
MAKQRGKRAPHHGKGNPRDGGAKSNNKPKEPTVCPQCGLLYKEGRWVNQPGPANAHEQLCPSCVKANSDEPDGILHLSGQFLHDHIDEIQALVEHVEAREMEEHSLNYIIDLEVSPEGMRVTTTDARLARMIAQAIQGAYDGNLEMGDSESTPLRIKWER